MAKTNEIRQSTDQAPVDKDIDYVQLAQSSSAAGTAAAPAGGQAPVPGNAPAVGTAAAPAGGQAPVPGDAPEVDADGNPILIPIGQLY